MGIGREAAIKLAMRAPTHLGRYGDAMQPRPFGVETLGASAPGADLRTWVVESVRHVWSIERPQVQARRFDWRSQIAETAQPASPRTRVDNCTQSVPEVGQTSAALLPGHPGDAVSAQPRQACTMAGQQARDLQDLFQRQRVRIIDHHISEDNRTHLRP